MPSAPAFLLYFHSSHIVLQSDGELVIAGNGPDYTSGPDIEVTKRLGYKDSTSLLKYYPKLCRVIVKRHAEYRKVQFKARRHKLAAVLHEESPSSLRAAASGWVTTPVILVSNSLMSVKPSPNVMLRSERGSALKGRKSRRRGSGPLLYISTRSAGTLPESESKRC